MKYEPIRNRKKIAVGLPDGTIAEMQGTHFECGWAWAGVFTWIPTATVFEGIDKPIAVFKEWRFISSEAIEVKCSS